MLAAGIEVAAAVTNRDRAAGRGMELVASPVKRRAEEAGLEVLQPRSARDAGLMAALERIAPDVAVVVAYGQILPSPLLSIPRLGFVNLHFSLLPEYRGAAPVQQALIDGRSETGVSVIVLTGGMDEGPVLAAKRERIHPSDTAGTLGERLAIGGADLLVASLLAYASGSLEPVEQDHARATYAPKLTPERARISWKEPRSRIRNLVRATNPTPGAWTTLRGQRMKIHEVECAGQEAPALRPGELAYAGGLYAGAGDGARVVCSAQMAGKRPLSGPELARGLQPAPGEGFD
ncbi:methionyl-tRNA formyltransferase [soil metagenome]